MKKIFTLFIVLTFASSIKGFAQGNLQFNQVISGNYNLGSWGANGLLSPVLVVPTNKVWKVEFVGSSSGGTSCSYSLNGQLIPFLSNNQSIANNNIWLKAGDSFALYSNISTNCSVFYSIIEFNIIP
jgi:hypothetical protein